MKSGFAGLREGRTDPGGGGRNRRPDKSVRVTVLSPGLFLGLLAAAVAAASALDRWGEPGRRAAFTTLTKDGGVVVALALSRDGRSLAVARAGEPVTIWDVASHRRRWLLPTLSLDRGLAFSPDGEVLAVADQGPAIKLWHPDTGERLGTLECPGRKFIWLAYSPDGRTLAASCHDDSLVLWDVPTGGLQDTRKGHCLTPGALAFSADGRSFAFTDRAGSILVWDVARGRVRAELPGHRSRIQSSPGTNVSLAFAPGGTVLASHGAFDPLVKLWDVDGARLLDTIEVEPSQGQVVSFSADGARLLLAGRGTVREWNIAGRRSETLVDGLSLVQPCLATTPDGARTLAIAEGERLTLRQRATGPRAVGASPAFRAHAAVGEGGTGP